ncbi:flippase [candidate division WOR-3 bacterium]|nr:flippase [candidate division WOR-3 bacterium]
MENTSKKSHLFFTSNKYFKDSSLTFLTQIVNLPIGIITGVIIARTFGPQGKGVIDLVKLFPFLLALFGSLGFEPGNVYLLGKQAYSFKNAESNSLALSVGIGIILIFCAFISRKWLVTNVLKGITPLYFYLAIISVPFLLFIRYSIANFQGISEFKKLNLLNFANSVSRLMFIILFVVILKWGVYGGVLSFTISAIATSAFASFIFLEIRTSKFSPNISLMKDSFNYGIKAHIGNVFQFFNYRFDIFIVSYFLGLKEVGFYALAVVIAELLWYIPMAFSVTLFPKIAGLDAIKANEFTAKVCRTVLLITIGGAFFLAAISKPLVFILYGKIFYPSLTPLRILLPGIVTLGLTKLLTSHLAGRGKPYSITYLSGISLVFTVFLDFILIPKWGIAGAAFATTVSYTISGVLAVLWFTKDSQKSLRDTLIPRKSDLREYKKHFLNIFKKTRL